MCILIGRAFQLFTLVKSTTDVKIPLKTNSLSIPLCTPAEMCLYPLSAQQHATPKQADLGLFMNLWFRSLTVGLKGPMATLLEKGSFINNYCMMLVNNYTSCLWILHLLRLYMLQHLILLKEFDKSNRESKDETVLQLVT